MNEGDEVLPDLPDIVPWLCGQREQQRLSVFSPQPLGLPQGEDWDVIKLLQNRHGESPQKVALDCVF